LIRQAKTAKNGKMKSFLLYILESSICISVLYLLFRIILRKESSFGVNRTTLLAVIVFSIVIPFLQLPQQMQTPVHLVIFPELQVDQLPVQRQTIDLQNKETLEEIQPIRFESTNVTTPEKKLSISTIDLIKYIYLAGVLVAFTLLIRNIILILMLFRKARVVKKVDYRLLIVDGEVPSFAFGHSVMISQKDFDLHGSAIITHEQSHIRLNHFYDLILLEENNVIIFQYIKKNIKFGRDWMILPNK
jgi:hypothetical protein